MEGTYERVSDRAIRGLDVWVGNIRRDNRGGGVVLCAWIDPSPVSSLFGLGLAPNSYAPLSISVRTVRLLFSPVKILFFPFGY